MHERERTPTDSTGWPILLVTGGSRGIGAATARLAAGRGFAVCINYFHRQSEAEALSNDIRSAGGIAMAIQADISVESEVVHLFESLDSNLAA